MNKYSTKQTAFTLVELLVVISVIGVLAGLLFPTIGAAIRAAKRTKAKTECKNLVTAFHAYYTEFGYWPTNSADNFDITTNTFCNAKGIHFFDFSQTDYIDLQARYLDPWRQPYRFRVDINYDNSISSPTGGSVAAMVLTWSFGPDGGTPAETRDTPKNPKTFVGSW